MPYKLISLVFLLFFLIINKAYSENEFLYPVKKPSIFKKFEVKDRENINKNLPQSKPTIQTEVTKKKDVKKKFRSRNTN